LVLLKPALAGACFLVVGIILVTVLGQYLTVEVQQVQTRPVEPNAEFLVGDVVDRSYSLPASVSTSGSVGVTQAPTNASGDIHFMIFDADNYQKWTAGSQSSSLFSAQRLGTFNYTFTTTNNGIYHFVFDNRASLYKKYVVLSVNYAEVVVSHMPDPRIPYLGLALIVGGAIILVFGLLRKPHIPWA
jgi:hypothetical protein